MCSILCMGVYSLFISVCLDASVNKLDAGDAEEVWTSMEAWMWASSPISNPNEKILPSNFGLRQRQSGSSVKVIDVLNEARDVVLHHALSGGLGRV